MGISDHDVEPVVGPRFWMVVLGVVGAVAGVLAVIGWPVPVVPSRYGSDAHAWEQTVGDIRAWLAHDGWRMSGASWFHGSLAVAALAGIVVLRHPSWSERWSVLVVVGPTAALLVLGPVAQWALGLPWSNYAPGSSGGIALIILVVTVVGAGFFALRRIGRSSTRPDDGGNPPPTGVR